MKVSGEIDKHNQSQSNCFQAFSSIIHRSSAMPSETLELPVYYRVRMGPAANSPVSIFGPKVSKGDTTVEHFVFLDFEEMDVT
jgi:hypothetical protein